MKFYLALRKNEIRSSTGGWIDLELSTLNEASQTSKTNITLFYHVLDKDFSVSVYTFPFLPSYHICKHDRKVER